ncbi:6-phosphogluconolactonase [Bradyrhizobium sp. dw_78]|uniref:6-phosphogluconolactonase n=1 Tax=Bradyrhizobium sp. dw_78 TaxID=2719793 RepID=UPI001BD2FFF6|nr:6-phosphogluconolactonase [Bradyrhizobium sp. dw_78]
MTSSSQAATQVIAVADPAALAQAAAERLMARIAKNSGRVAICLSGGSSPKQLFELLATEAYRSRIPWDRVHWFSGDERFVPADDPLSNIRMARLAFLDRCAPSANVHPISTAAANPLEAARQYESELKSFYGAGELDPARPLFDLVLLGIGPDGHTASLFPGYPAVAETRHWVIDVPKAHVEPFVPRITLTLPALACCREMLFEASGSAKRAILTRVFDGEDLPANRARSQGETIWLLDKAALPENFRA